MELESILSTKVTIHLGYYCDLSVIPLIKIKGVLMLILSEQK